MSDVDYKFEEGETVVHKASKEKAIIQKRCFHYFSVSYFAFVYFLSYGNGKTEIMRFKECETIYENISKT